jgi:DNA processing protein
VATIGRKKLIKYRKICHHPIYFLFRNKSIAPFLSHLWSAECVLLLNMAATHYSEMRTSDRVGSFIKDERDKYLKIALLAVEGIGWKTLFYIEDKLAELKSSLDQFWQCDPKDIWRKCKLNKRQIVNLKKFQKRFSPEGYFGWIQEQQIEVLTLDDKKYPFLLKKSDDPPLIIYTKGVIERVNQRPIAVVGTRQVSGYGRSVIGQLLPELITHDVSIVSGFMYGVDTLAQQQAMELGGYTLGVLGFGFDFMYPANNKRLFSKMLAEGHGFITEYPPWVRSHKGNFRQRNRIVAGLSLATVVIEAARKSGSHITARFAGSYGRGLCAVPGPINSPYSEGTKWLMNDGAKLVTSAADILEQAGLFPGGWGSELCVQAQRDQTFVTKPNFTDLIQEKIYSFLQANPHDTFGIAKGLSLSITQLNSALGMLEIDGLIEQKNGVWYVLDLLRNKN